MNKLTKVGCSALCGSLAAISAAQAGDITVTGGADMTWIHKGGTAGDPTGNPIGMGSNLTFKGSGELDNGWTFALTIANKNASVYSSSNIDIVMGGLGSINIDQGDSGNGLSAFDDKMPTAWEETWGGGLGTGIRLITGAGSNMNVMYTTPKVLGTTLTYTIAPDVGVTQTADKNTGSAGEGTGKQQDLTININPSLGTEILSGLNLFAGASILENYDNHATIEEDQYEGTFGITLDIGPLSLGSQWMGEYTGEEVDKAYIGYKTHAFGVAFNINDDLSVSYAEFDQRKAAVTHSAAYTGRGDRVSIESLQVAYSVGGASIRLAEHEADNVSFSADNNKEATVLSVGLAF
tara:strand:- start:2984 stop:4033 length:1050 start_codon:yes stop_codon:yes gene_type:complete